MESLLIVLFLAKLQISTYFVNAEPHPKAKVKTVVVRDSGYLSYG